MKLVQERQVSAHSSKETLGLPLICLFFVLSQKKFSESRVGVSATQAWKRIGTSR